MQPVTTINLESIAQSERVKNILALLHGQKAFPATLIVGGAVRNILLGVGVQDVDLATQFTPQEVMEILAPHKDIKIIPTGIDHGTLTLVQGGMSMEVTTLRRDEQTDGRHADVAFTQDWVEDAKRRDFTMNALYADAAGQVYDPLGQGMADVARRKVRFVGAPAERIAEDYLRILRFFRFYGYYGQGDADAAALSACGAAAQHIGSLSRERITQEFLKILEAPKAEDVLALMTAQGVLAEILAGFEAQSFKRLRELQEKYGAIERMPRLFCVAGNAPRFFDDYLRLSHLDKKFLVKLEMAFQPAFYGDEKHIKRAIFHHGNAVLVQGYLLAVAAGKMEEAAEKVALLKNWSAPPCPITGDMLIAEGFCTGPDLGLELERRREEWLEGVI